MNTKEEVKPYIITRAPNGFSMYNYLRISGGAGHGKPHLGGTYLFVASYLCSEDDEEMGRTSMEKFCRDKQIPFGYGNTIEEALTMLMEELRKTPLK